MLVFSLFELFPTFICAIKVGSLIVSLFKIFKLLPSFSSLSHSSVSGISIRFSSLTDSFGAVSARSSFLLMF